MEFCETCKSSLERNAKENRSVYSKPVVIATIQTVGLRGREVTHSREKEVYFCSKTCVAGYRGDMLGTPCPSCDV